MNNPKKKPGLAHILNKVTHVKKLDVIFSFDKKLKLCFILFPVENKEMVYCFQIWTF